MLGEPIMPVMPGAVVAKSQTRHGPLGVFVWRRYTVVQDFHCDHCEQPKKSRIVAELRRESTAAVDTLCNGCYGELLVKRA
jgi:hypothetical protein